jgi:FkbM family methyltransferase
MTPRIGLYGKADPDNVVISRCRYGQFVYLKNDRYMGRALARFGEYSESEVEAWRQLLSPNALVADVGANIGIHTVALSSLVPDGGVYCFEPLTYLYRFLEANLAANACMNVVSHNKCVGNPSPLPMPPGGSAIPPDSPDDGYDPPVIYVPPCDYTVEDELANYGGMSMLGHAAGIPIQVVSLDACCPRLNLIKADVEGMEWNVIQGARRIIRECQPIIYCENNPGPNQETLIQQIQSIGYDCWWHLAPHYNPDSFIPNPPDPDTEHVVSYNMLCFPKGDPRGRPKLGNPIP